MWKIIQENNKKEVKKEVKKEKKYVAPIVRNNIEKTNVKEISEDSNTDKIRSFMKEFIVNSKLDMRIKNIKKEENRYVVNLEGRDVRFLIGEKGIGGWIR